MNESQSQKFLKFINNTNINSTIINNASINSFLSNKNSNYLLFGIILVLIIILIISIIVLIFLFKKEEKIKYVSNNIGLNKIIIKNSNLNNSRNIMKQKGGFQKVQNTSKVNDIIQPNNVLNEIKSNSLENEIHKIIHTSSSSSSNSFSGGKRLLRKKNGKLNLNTSGSSTGKGDNNLDNNNAINKENKKGNLSEENTHKLEKELKEQIKKYVIEEHNI